MLRFVSTSRRSAGADPDCICSVSRTRCLPSAALLRQLLQRIAFHYKLSGSGGAASLSVASTAYRRFAEARTSFPEICQGLVPCGGQGADWSTFWRKSFLSAMAKVGTVVCPSLSVAATVRHGRRTQRVGWVFDGSEYSESATRGGEDL